MLWVDKYRPSKLDDLSYHEEITTRLRSLASNPAAMPHLFFYGQPGAGKKTRINALLRQLYGPGVEKLKLDKRVFTTPTKRTVEINMITSNYHIEISPGDAGLNDTYVVQDIIKEMASSKNIAAIASVSSASASAGSKKAVSNAPEFKTVVLTEVDRLSRQAQAALRRTMEKYASTCRLILCCNSQSKVIEPVRSRCLGIRVAAPTVDNVSRQREDVEGPHIGSLLVPIISITCPIPVSYKFFSYRFVPSLKTQHTEKQSRCQMNSLSTLLASPRAIFVELCSCWRPVTYKNETD